MRKLEDLASRIKDAYRECACTMPLDKITVASLCRKLGISRKAFYTRFESREMVLDSILRDDLVAPLKVMYPALVKTVDENVSSRILIENTYQAIAAQHGFYSRLVTLNDESMVNHMLQKSLQEAQSYSRTLAGLPASQKSEYAETFLSASHAAIIIRWLRSGADVPIPTIAGWFDEWSASVVRTIAAS